MAIEPASEVFRHNVLMLMEQQSLSQVKLARAIGTKGPTLNRVLAGKERVTLDRAERIAKHFGLPLSALIAEKFSQPVHST